MKLNLTNDCKWLDKPAPDMLARGLNHCHCNQLGLASDPLTEAFARNVRFPRAGTRKPLGKSFTALGVTTAL